jgi:hypothetical protein
MTTSTIIRRTGATMAVGLLAGVLATGTPAQAGELAARTSSTSGSCSKGGAYIDFDAHYHNSSRYHVFTSFSWTIGGNGVRNKNNVQFRVKHNNSLGHDHIYWTWTSPDNIRKGYSAVTSSTKNGGPVKRGGVKVPKNKRAYVEFKAVFDKAGSDPKCSAHTSGI